MDKWYVKTSEGKVYGPAAVARLLEWAKEGRLEPGSFLSQDRHRWAPAAALRELGMQWIVGTEDGALFGPFHADVVQTLRANGEVPSSARIYRLFSGDEDEQLRRLREEMSRSADEQRLRFEAELKRVAEEKAGVSESLGRKLQELERQRGELASVRSDLARAQQDLVAEQEKVLVEQARAQQVVAAAREKNEAGLAEARRIADEAVSERNRAVSERQRAEEQLALARKTIEEEHARAARLGQVFAKKQEDLQSAVEAAQRRIAELEADSKKKPKSGWGGLFSGSKGPDLAMIEEAARRELEAARRRSAARPAADSPKSPGDVIDIG